SAGAGHAPPHRRASPRRRTRSVCLPAPPSTRPGRRPGPSGTPGHGSVVAMLDRAASGHGIATIADDGTVLDTWYLSVSTDLVLRHSGSGVGRVGGVGTEHLEGKAGDVLGLPRPEHDPARGVRRVAVDTKIGSLAEPPIDAHDVYLRLHLLSHRAVRPNEC